MPRYRVTERSFIDGQIIEVGAEVDYAGIPSFNLEPLDPKAAAKAQNDAKEALAREAVGLKAHRLDAEGKPTKDLIDGTESLEAIQAAVAAAKQLQVG